MSILLLVLSSHGICGEKIDVEDFGSPWSSSSTDGFEVARRQLLGQKDHAYKVHEKVPLYANKIGPFHNPSETYQHYDLPFCLPADNQIGYKSEDLGEVLEGDRLVGTPYDISFRVDRDNESLCKKTLNSKDLKKFRKAVKDDYCFQMY